MLPYRCPVATRLTVPGAILTEREHTVPLDHAKPGGPSITVAKATTARGGGFARAAAIGSDVFVAWTEQNASASRVHVTRIRW